MNELNLVWVCDATSFGSLATDAQRKTFTANYSTTNTRWEIRVTNRYGHWYGFVRRYRFANKHQLALTFALNAEGDGFWMLGPIQSLEECQTFCAKYLSLRLDPATWENRRLPFENRGTYSRAQLEDFFRPP